MTASFNREMTDVAPPMTLAWPGDEVANGMTAQEYIAHERTPSAGEIIGGSEFYNGDQWPKSARQARLSKGRPCLVINRLPGIVSMLCANSQRSGEALTGEEYITLIAIVVRRNLDAQRFYNYTASSIAEQNEIPPTVVLSRDSIDKTENGITYVKPPRNQHCSWIVRLLDRITRLIDPAA